MYLLRYFIIFFLFFGLASSILAQHKSISSNLKSDEKRAAELFDKGAYAEAIEVYKEVLAKKGTASNASLKIAESYFYLNDHQEAVEWYSKAFANNASLKPENKLHYGQALMTLKKYTEAKKWLDDYSAEVPTDRRAKLLSTATSDILSFYKDSLLYELKHLKTNTAFPDFGPSYYQKGLVFVSGQSKVVPMKYVDTKDQKSFLDLYYGEIDSTGEFKELSKFQRINSKYHDGPLSFYDQERKVIFTRSSIGNTPKNKQVTLKIFEAEKAEDDIHWTNVKPFPYNSDTYSVAHPSISEDGSLLFFASDMPGGFGQSDIYVCQRKNGEWTKPENLGPEINTEGNEIFPFFNNNQILYFASNGLGGLGGLDIFRWKWSFNTAKPVNLGYPINTSGDDFGLILNEKNSTGYFSSNRIPGRGDDLYWFKNNSIVSDSLTRLNATATTIQGNIFNAQTGKPVEGARIYILNEVTGEEINLISDDLGNFSFNANTKDSYAIMGEKDDMSALLLNVKASIKEEENVIQLPILKPNFNKQIVIEATVRDNINQELVRLAHVNLFENEVLKTSEVTQASGKVFFKANTSRNYTIKVESTLYEPLELPVSTKVYLENDTLEIFCDLKRNDKRSFTTSGIFYESKSGMSIPNAEVYILDGTNGEEQTVFTDESGVFNFNAVKSHSYAFMAEKGDLSAFLVDIEMQGPEVSNMQVIKLAGIRPNFSSPLIIEAVVIDKKTKEPLRLISTGLLKEDNTHDFNYTNSKGKAYFSVQSDGNYKLKVAGKSYVSQVVETANNSDEPQDTLTVKIELEKAKAISALVTAKIVDGLNDKPLSQAKIFILNEVTGEEQELTANDKGIFSFKANFDDSYSILGEKGKKSAFVINVEVNDSLAKNDQWLVLEALEPVFEPVKTPRENIFLVVTTINKLDKKPIRLANVKVLEGETPKYSGMTGQNGKVVFQIDLRKEFIVRASNANFSDAFQTISTNSTQDTLYVDLEMESSKKPQVTLYGNIFDLVDNKPLSDASIYILNEKTGDQLSITADDKGNFEFLANPDDTYAILGEKGDKSALLINVNASDAAKDVYNKIRLTVDPTNIGKVVLSAIVLDSLTKEVVKLALVKVLQNGDEKEIAYTDFSGKALAIIPQGADYILEVSNKNYEVKRIAFTTKNLAVGDTVELKALLKRTALERERVIAKLYDERTGKGIPNATVYLLNEISGEEKNLTTDSKGMFFFEAKKDESFGFIAEKDTYSAAEINIMPPANSKDTLKLVAQNLKLKKNIILEVSVSEKVSNEPIKMVLIKVKHSNGEELSLHSNSEGVVYSSIEINENYTVLTEQVNYRNKSHKISTTNFKGDTLKVDLKLEKLKNNFATIYGQVVDEKTGEPLSNATITVIDENTKELETYYTDVEGKFQFKADVESKYTIEGNKDEYSVELTGIRAESANTQMDNPLKLFSSAKGKRVNQILTAEEIRIVEVLSGKEQVFISSNGTLYEYVKSENKPYLRNKKEKKLLSRQLYTPQGKSLYNEFKSYIDTTSITSKVMIKNIYYEFNKSVLTVEAKEELERIADVMHEHEQVSLQLNAFADNRGSNNYNSSLSQKRARAALDYLLSKGIDRSRIVFKGLGESKLVKPCPRPQDCTEEQHQMNRRAEFVILF